MFSFYTAFSGYRVLTTRRPGAKRPDIVGWAVAGATFAASLAMIVLGVVAPSPAWRQIGVVSAVLGAVGIMLASRDMAAMARPTADRMVWWYAHMSRMLASYIAAFTAFSVLNFTMLPLTVRWLWPTLLGTPLIALWRAYYKRRFARVASAPAGSL